MNMFLATLSYCPIDFVIYSGIALLLFIFHIPFKLTVYFATFYPASLLLLDNYTHKLTKYQHSNVLGKYA